MSLEAFPQLRLLPFRWLELVSSLVNSFSPLCNEEIQARLDYIKCRFIGKLLLGRFTSSRTREVTMGRREERKKKENWEEKGRQVGGEKG